MRDRIRANGGVGSRKQRQVKADGRSLRTGPLGPAEFTDDEGHFCFSVERAHEYSGIPKGTLKAYRHHDPAARALIDIPGSKRKHGGIRVAKLQSLMRSRGIIPPEMADAIRPSPEGSSASVPEANAAPKGRAGRPQRRREEAEFANALRSVGLTWKEIAARWKQEHPDDRREDEEIRNSWRNHFGGKRAGFSGQN